MNIVIALLLAYLLGSIPSGLWIGKLIFHKDLHEHGSGNTGATNTFRTLGVTAGMVVFIIDLLKGTLAVMLPMSFLFDIKGISPLIFGLLAVLGHTISIFDKFKGGKAVATSGGVILGYQPTFLLFLLIVFVIILILFSMISLSSISAAFAAIFGIAVFPAFHFILNNYNWFFSLIICIMSAVILVKHRSNMNRIRDHQESLVPFGFNLSHQNKRN
ncbi:glycerol-3-phosphate 1-O-acyltransferase PlsY [Lactovum miscens]|uniref:Glycerol-3-phosphate acyltransferase n=1 Tax=Lactovum miscens TaxID=190387 RepID=A0A841C6H4_9LACT|nr:glycerol-3-phosphate 1-O-acyltransferase PlsY [Lactovum miscens]MBB5888065.1 glycerol-3-phosphate acyltransferase PlsY [Lactovum miscens]